MAVRRVADVVRQAGHVDEVGIATQSDRHAAPIWATSSEWVSRVRGVSLWRGPDDLRLVGQPAQCSAVQDPGPVTREIGAVFGVGAGQRAPFGDSTPDAAVESS